MKVPFLGMTDYQGSPTHATMRVEYLGRLEDGAGKAAPAYVDFYATADNLVDKVWRDDHDRSAAALLLVTPSDARPIPMRITETFHYADRAPAESTYEKWSSPSNLDGSEFDYTQPQQVFSVAGVPLTFQAAFELIGAGGNVLVQVGERLGELDGVLADIAQYAGGVTLRNNLAAITGADGYYKASDTGYVYQRAGGVNTRRPNMEALSLGGLYFVDARTAGVSPLATGAANLTALQSLVDTAPLDSIIVVPPGEYLLGNCLFINRRITLDVRGVTWKLQSDSAGGNSLIFHGGPLAARTSAAMADLYTGGPYYGQELVGAKVLGWSVKSASGARLGTTVMCIYLRACEIDVTVRDSYGNGLSVYHCDGMAVPLTDAKDVSDYAFFAFQSRGIRSGKIRAENCGRGLINKHSWHGTGQCDNTYQDVELIDLTAELWAGGGANYEGVPGAAGVPPIYEGSYEISRGVVIEKMTLRKTVAGASSPQVTLGRHSDGWNIRALTIDGGGFAGTVSPLTIGANGTAGGLDGEDHTFGKITFRNMNLVNLPLIDYGVAFRVDSLVVRDSKINKIMKDGVILPFGTVKSAVINGIDIVADLYLGASGDMGFMPRSTTDFVKLGIVQAVFTPIANGANATAQAMAIQAKRMEITGGFKINKGPAQHTVTIGAFLAGGGGRWLNATNSAENPGTLQTINVGSASTGLYEIEERHTATGATGGAVSIIANAAVRLLNPTRTGFGGAIGGTAGSLVSGTAPALTGTAAPTVSARWAGDEFIDTTNNRAYRSTKYGTGAGDWIPVNPASVGPPVSYGIAAPTTGAHVVGEIVWRNNNFNLGINTGWICRTAGTPGTWEPFGQAGVRVATAAPTFNAQFLGEEMLDTAAGKWYKAVTTGSGAADWVALN